MIILLNEAATQMDILDRLIEHDGWTTQLILGRCGELTSEQWLQSFDISHATVHASLVHILGNVEVWTDLMYERPLRKQPMPPSGPDALPAWQARFAAASEDFANLARSRAASGQLDALWIDVLDEPPQYKTFGGAIAHVLTHSMIHRSELLHMLQRLGLTNMPEGDVLSWEQAVSNRDTQKGNAPMTTIKTKSQLIERLRQERAVWESLLAEVGEERMTQPGPMGDWTMKDVVAHVTGWGKQHIARLQAAQRANTPILPIEIEDEENDDADPINQGIYDANKDRSLSEVLGDSRAFWNQFEDLIGALPEQDLMDEERFSWMKGRALGPASVEDTAGHIHEEHEPNIRKWLARLNA